MTWRPIAYRSYLADDSDTLPAWTPMGVYNVSAATAAARDGIGHTAIKITRKNEGKRERVTECLLFRKAG